MARGRKLQQPPPSTPSPNSTVRATLAATRLQAACAAVLLVFATLLAYRGTASFPFVFDDEASITQNATIRQLWPPWTALSPPPDGGLTVSGRPLLNFSFALSRALSGNETWGYRVPNIAIHIAAGLVLFGLARRTLVRPAPPTVASSPVHHRLAGCATPAAATIAALWLLHPLQTESVTYIVQRAESLAGLFLLVTLDAFTRASDRSGWRARAWRAASFLACLAGMASKEVMAAAPVLVLLYDRTFVAGTFGRAWRARRFYYASMASTWLLLGILVFSAHGRGGTVGFSTPISPWDYLTTQAWAIVHYLRLVLWPSPLVLDYGYLVVTAPAVWIPCGVVVLALLGATVVGLVRRPALGFLGVWFFSILAPTSSFVPVATQPVTEHRIYLPLAAIVAFAVIAGVALAGRRALLVGVGVAVALGVTTARRNEDYRSVEAIWRDTIAKRPNNARAHRNLGLTLYHGGEVHGSLASLERALQLDPTSPEVHNYTANALLTLNRVREAEAHAAEAVRLAPGYGDAHNNLGVALARQRRAAEAIAHFEDAARLMPGSASPRINLAAAYLDSGRPDLALPLLDDAIAREPTLATAHLARGNALLKVGRMSEAGQSLAQAVALEPGLGEAQFALGNLLVDAGRPADAIPHLEQAVRLAPRSIPALNNLADALMRAGREAEAIAVFERALALDPGNPYLRDNLTRLKTRR